MRVSTAKQEVDNQLMQLEPFIKNKGWILTDRYIDIITGSKDSRPGFNRLFEDAHKLKFDVVVFWSLDRFSRSGTIFTFQKLKELDNLGIAWHSYQEQYITTVGPFKDVVISIFATIAKMERDRISERTKAGLARARANGKRFGPQCRKYKFSKIWAEYEREGSITRTAKVLGISYGVIQLIISNDIHDQESYEKLKNRMYLERKKQSFKGGGQNDTLEPSNIPSHNRPLSDTQEVKG